MRFADPWFLLLLVPALLVLVLAWRRRPPSLLIASAAFVGSGAESAWRRRLPLMLECAGLVVLILALARPQSGAERQRDLRQGIDIMIALDVSGSMTSYDPAKSMTDTQELIEAIQSGQLKDRLETAKLRLAEFVKARPDDRIGLVLFGSEALGRCPPTIDHGLLLKRIEEIENGMLGDYSNGTNIAAGINAAARRLLQSPSKRRVLILATDGANTVKSLITPEEAAAVAAKQGVTIHTIGIGSDNAYQSVRVGLDRYRLEKSGAESFDEELMKRLSEPGGGHFFRAADAEEFERTMKEIDKIEKVEIGIERQTQWQDRVLPFLIAGLILIVAGFVLSNTLWLRLP
ncbi:MAG: hypothetical protein RL095_3403 [Verrucomicrobiota bacterium]|jgi:Ca-activated chloride channel family protein